MEYNGSYITANSVATDPLWTDNRDVLEDLYITQGLSVKKVKEIMETRQGFPSFPYVSQFPSCFITSAGSQANSIYVLSASPSTKRDCAISSD